MVSVICETFDCLFVIWKSFRGCQSSEILEVPREKSEVESFF